MPEAPIAVLGAGSWGTSLALVIARSGRRTVLWARDPLQADSMAGARENLRYLPGHRFPAALRITGDLFEAMSEATTALVVVPSGAFRATLGRVPSERLGALAWATKGFEPGTGRLLHEVASDVLPRRIALAAISGPTFAAEVAAGLPAALTVASADASLASMLARCLAGDRLRVYTNDDLPGVGVGGAVKNVLAIAAGIADALGFGANARAALVARGLHEMSRLGIALGARRETMMGLTGLGDLVLTCTDDQSRNRRFGLAIGRGSTQDEALAAIGQTVEGIAAAREVDRLAVRHALEMPIAQAVARVLEDEITPRAAVRQLFARDPRDESSL